MFFLSAGIIGSHCYENAVGKAVTVNGVHYHPMITDFFSVWISILICFEQDGSTLNFKYKKFQWL